MSNNQEKKDKKIITLDIDKCFGCMKCLDVEPGLYSLIEKGIRATVCRRCENAPCVASCPVEALERQEGGELKRYVMKCVACKQCSSACPVGANPTAVLNYRTHAAHKLDIVKCKRVCFRGAINEVDEIDDGWSLIEENFAVKAQDWK